MAYRSDDQLKQNNVIFLQHGFTGSGDDFFVNGESGSLGFYLVQKGFEVWIGNSRGNKYSHSSSAQKISNSEFFDYSFQDMALFDIPAVYAFIISKIEKWQKIVYIGHSQGTQQFFAALADPLTSEF